MSLKDQIDKSNLPRHIAVIMDGNGRWAKQRGKIRSFGHRNGVKAVREISEAAAELGVEEITLYAFSTENWNRPAFEINTLMELLVNTMSKEIKTLLDNDIRLNAIGNIDALPKNCVSGLQNAIDKTSHCKRMTLTIALSYSSRWELTEAMKKIAAKIEAKELSSEDINEQLIQDQLCTTRDPELLIRTSGEHRISNFLLWQIAYSELHFTEVLWPDFRKEHLYEAIIDYQNRERRFGGVSSTQTA